MTDSLGALRHLVNLPDACVISFAGLLHQASDYGASGAGREGRHDGLH